MGWGEGRRKKKDSAGLLMVLDDCLFFFVVVERVPIRICFCVIIFPQFRMP